MQPREGVEQLLLGVRHDPAQVVLVRGLAPVGRVHAGQLDRRDGGGVGALEGGGDLRGGALGALRIRNPEFEAAVHNRLENAVRVQEILKSRTLGGNTAGRNRGTRFRDERALQRVGHVPGEVPGGRVVLQAEQDGPILAAQCRPGHGQYGHQRDGGDALGQAALERERDGRRGHELAQRDPVALAGQALEGACHVLGDGVRGGCSVAGLVAAPGSAGAGLACAHHRDLPVLELRLCSLGCGALLGHRGCLPVAAVRRCVWARA